MRKNSLFRSVSVLLRFSPTCGAFTHTSLELINVDFRTNTTKSYLLCNYNYKVWSEVRNKHHGKVHTQILNRSDHIHKNTWIYLLEICSKIHQHVEVLYRSWQKISTIFGPLRQKIFLSRNPIMKKWIPIRIFVLSFRCVRSWPRYIRHFTFWSLVKGNKPSYSALCQLQLVTNTKRNLLYFII